MISSIHILIIQKSYSRLNPVPYHESNLKNIIESFKFYAAYQFILALLFIIPKSCMIFQIRPQDDPTLLFPRFPSSKPTWGQHIDDPVCYGFFSSEMLKLTYENICGIIQSMAMN